MISEKSCFGAYKEFMLGRCLRRKIEAKCRISSYSHQPQLTMKFDLDALRLKNVIWCSGNRQDVFAFKLIVAAYSRNVISDLRKPALFQSMWIETNFLKARVTGLIFLMWARACS